MCNKIVYTLEEGVQVLIDTFQRDPLCADKCSFVSNCASGLSHDQSVCTKSSGHQPYCTHTERSRSCWE